MKSILRSTGALWALLIACAGCGDDATTGGEGNVVFSTWGEEYIEDAIPAETFADGYTVTYSKFLVVLGNIEVADAEGNVAASHDRFLLVDHTKAGVKPVISFDALPAASYPKVSYELGVVAKSEIDVAEGAATADVDLVAGKFSVYVEGTISKGTITKTFKWGFAEPTLLNECKGEKDGKEVEGVVVTNGGTDEVELTIHGDHLFYDDLQSQDAKVRGQAIVDADIDGDNVITQAELTAVKLIDLPEGQYGTGSLSSVNDLGAFVSFLSRTVGHYRGEGECFVTDP